MYDFTTLPRRRDIGAEKWAELDRLGVDQADVIPFSVADMDLPAAPEIVQALHEAVDFGVYGYTVPEAGYRAAVGGWMARRHGWEIRPEWIVPAFGVVHAISQAIHAFTAPGDGVIYQPPAYPPFRKVPRALERTLLPNPLRRNGTRWEMDYEGLEALCARPEAKLLLLCSPHNPTGRVWTRAELSRVAEICRAHDVLVLSDEIHFDFVFPPHRHTVFAALEERCIVATAASKTFNLAGLCTANVIISDPALRARFEAKAAGYTGFYNGYFGVAATRAAYERGEAWLDALLGHIQGNYDYAKAFLAEKFPSVAVAPLEGTYLLWADFSSLGLDPKALERFLREEALLFTDEGYIFGPEGEGWERLVLACPRRPLQAALERLDGAAARRGLPRGGQRAHAANGIQGG